MQLKGKPHQELEIATLKKISLKKKKEKTKRERKKERIPVMFRRKRQDSSGKPDQEVTVLEN